MEVMAEKELLCALRMQLDSTAMPKPGLDLALNSARATRRTFSGRYPGARIPKAELINIDTVRLPVTVTLRIRSDLWLSLFFW